MSDEASRSARPYGQRRNDGAPTWWAALDRTDLPDTEVLTEAHRRWYEDATPMTPAQELAAHPDPAPVRRGWLVSLLAALAIVVVLGIAWGVDTTDGQVLFVTLLIGIPVGLAAAAMIFVARRSG
jgi:ferric-dicitrate binding protein FerR (iron transport regulator)